MHPPRLNELSDIVFAEKNMTFGEFLAKQFISVIQWNEPADGILAYRYPMRDMEIENGGQLTVSESQMAAFVNEGKIADVFGPGLHTLNTRNLPLLTDLMNWDKAFESPSSPRSTSSRPACRLTRSGARRRPSPSATRSSARSVCAATASTLSALPIRAPSSIRSAAHATLLRRRPRRPVARHHRWPHDRDLCVSDLSFLDMAANQDRLGDKIVQQMKPAFAALGLSLEQFVVENVSLPEELQKVFDQRIGMNMVGDLGRYTLYAAAESLDLSAANTSGAAGMGMGLGAGAAVAQVLSNALKPAMIAPGAIPSQQPAPAPAQIGASVAADSAPAEGVKFCIECGKPIPQRAKFCAECGKAQ
jgi:membrane protease subunit (stomatin/prohibitin family)